MQVGVVVSGIRSSRHRSIFGLNGLQSRHCSNDYKSLLLDAICIVDVNVKCVNVSGACESIFGYTPAEMVGKNMNGFGLPRCSVQDHAVLLAMMREDGVVIRRKIIETLGEDDYACDQRRLDTQIRRLRRKVDQACAPLPVNTLRSVGFQFFQKATI